jgi:6-phosphogluconolactonase (cycloisomerase 2 family)
MQRRITQLVGSLAFSVFTSFLVVLALFASPVSAATGPDASGNGGATTHGVSKTHPATGAAFSAEITGTHYVYVNNGSSPNSVSGYKLASGGLTPLLGSPYLTGGVGSGSGYGGNQIAISPDHKCVFASDDGSGTFNSFKINSTTGSLTLVTHATVEGSNVQAIAVSPLGGVVFVDMFVSYSNTPLDSFSVGSGCAITEAQNSNTNSAAGSLAVSNDGTLLFASSYVGGFINAYAISGTSFTLLKSNPANPSAPGGLVVAGKHLYSGNAGSNSETGAYTFNTGGTLTSLPGSPATDSQGGNSAQVWFDHTDKQLICSEQYTNSFGIFHVSSGTYSFLAHVNGTGTNPTAMAQVNHILIVTNDGGASISVYKVEPGSITYKTSISLPASGSPNGIAAF